MVIIWGRWEKIYAFWKTSVPSLSGFERPSGRDAEGINANNANPKGTGKKARNVKSPAASSEKGVHGGCL